MKMWNQYGSEHSMSLVMIGSFKEVRDAEVAERLIDELVERMRDEPDSIHDQNPDEARFSNEMRDFLMNARLSTIGPDELQQFRYDVRAKRDRDKITLTTDESEISAFLKLFIEKGARVEIYSTHDYPS